MSLKYSISSPLEAGTSILDGALPAHVNTALEYVSRKLAKRDVNLTLVIVRRDYQLPLRSIKPVSSLASTTLQTAPLGSGKTKSHNPSFSLSSIKQIVRSNSFPLACFSSSSSIQERTVDVPASYDEGFRTGTVSPAFSVSSVSSMASTVSTASTVESSVSGCRQWPFSPTTPYSATMPATPATPHSGVSMVTHTTTDASSAVSGFERRAMSSTLGVKLVHTSPVSLKEERILRQTMQKAERKFHLGPDYFPPAVAPSECGLTADLVHRSLAQNELIFSSTGLCLLMLDHLYTFKSALTSYAATQASCLLEDAVDELRRLVLAQGGRKLRKSVLQSSFEWLGPVSDSALSDVIRMYRRAYGGTSEESGVENDVDATTNTIHTSTSWPLPDEPLVMIGSEANDKPLPALPEETWQSASETASESGESSGWESEDLPSLHLSRTKSNRIQKRFAVVGLDSRCRLDYEVEDYYHVSSARDLLTEREEAEAAAWAAAGASGEEADVADGMLIIGLTEGTLSAARPSHLALKTSPQPCTEDAYFLPLSFPDEVEVGRVTPKAEKPRLQLQTSVPSPSLTITKPVALRMPPLKLQTSFTTATTKPQFPQAFVPSTPANRRLTLSGAETTFGLVGMTPIEGRMPNFDALLAGHRADKRTSLEDEDDDDGELTAKPISGHPSRQHRWTQRWNNIGIDGRLSSRGTLPLEQQQLQDDRLGPMTPNGYDDISPVTRGEWGFLFQGETWQPGRTVTVETC